MKALAWLFLFGICLELHAAATNTNLLAIHFVTEQLPRGTLWYSNVNPVGLKLQPDPVFSDHDFVTFRTNQGECFIAVAPAAAKRWAANCGRENEATLWSGKRYELTGCQTPFVLSAFGEPIYVGVFSSLTSSQAFGVPEWIPDAPYIPKDLSTNLVFWVRFRSSEVAPEEQRQGFDVRCDPRIVAALRKLGI